MGSAPLAGVVASRGKDGVVGGSGDLLGTAEALSLRGYRVFPIAGKKPLVSDYQGTRSRNPGRPYSLEQLRSMPWGDATGIGLAVKPGVIVLDADVKNGQHGVQHLRLLQEHVGVLPPSWQQVTPSGGVHWMFTCPDDVGKLPSRLLLADGTQADIDIIRAGYAQIAVYDPESLCRARIEPLPSDWVEHLHSLRDSAGNRVTDPWKLLRESTVHQRNTNLNRAAFALALKYGKSRELRDALTVQARALGLEAQDIDATVSSAFTAAEKKREYPMMWKQAVSCDPNITSRRNKVRLVSTASVMARVAIHTGKTIVGMSIRQLAEQLACHQQTAAKQLRILTDAGYLHKGRFRKFDEASTFVLKMPRNADSLDTHPGGAFRVSTYSAFSQVDVDVVLSHEAFIRRKGEVVLSETAGLLLWLLQGFADGAPRRGLARRIGRHRDSVAKAVLILESAGLVCVGDGLVRLVDVDVLGSLDRWCVLMGVDGRLARRKAEFQLQRQVRAASRERMGSNNINRITGG